MKIIKSIYSRIVIIGIVVLLELLSLYLLLRNFYAQTAWIEAVLKIISIFLVVGIANYSKHLSFDIFWMIMIIVSPVFGTTLYLLIGADQITNKTHKSLLMESDKADKYYQQDKQEYEAALTLNNTYKGQIEYIVNNAHFPIYANDNVKYFELGDNGFPCMIEELLNAKKFIFLEYFIIEDGIMWQKIINILEDKVKQGVEVRVMYDDVGSVMTVPSTFVNELKKKGIKCISFNRLNPIVSIVVNHRDHRKILVIDGKVAFTGGINIADEYINQKKKYGHWKDNVIRVAGNAVWSFTVLFLTNWNAISRENEDYEKYHVISTNKKTKGYIAPYGDMPFDDESVGQNVYLNILHQAKDYCYIMTPYLIIDSDMKSALIMAKKRGVDIRIITPGIPDKKIIWKITKSYYPELLREGIKIYEYTPGFVHAKVFISDDVIATVGTINLDYRSLYLHFENGLFLYYVDEIKKIKDDFIKTIEQCHEIQNEDIHTSFLRGFILSLIRLFSPML